MSFSFFFFFFYIKSIKSLDVYISVSHEFRCSVKELHCVGEKSRPFSDFSDALAYIRFISEDFEKNDAFFLKIFLQSNEKQQPYMVLGVAKEFESFFILPGLFYYDDFFFFLNESMKI